MPPCCIICGNVRNIPGISFHKFPSNYQRRQKWIAFIRKYDIQPHTITKYSYLCSRHFNADLDFIELPHRRRLKDSAIPVIVKNKPQMVIENTINLESSEYSVLKEHNYFHHSPKTNNRWSDENSEYSEVVMYSPEQSMDDPLPKQYTTSSDEEDGQSDTEIKSLSQLLRLEYEKDLLRKV